VAGAAHVLIETGAVGHGSGALLDDVHYLSVSSSAVLCELTVPASCKSISFPCYSRFSDVYAIFSAQDLPISRYRGAFFISYYLRF